MMADEAKKPRIISIDGFTDTTRGNRERGDHSCFLCYRKLSKSDLFIHVVDGGSGVLHPEDEGLYEDEGLDMGGFPIGPSCARKLGLEWTSK